MADDLGGVGRRGIWVYAVATCVRREWFGQADGIGGRPVWGVTAIPGRLAAAVSGISLGEFGPEALNRADRARLEWIARAHRDVAGIVAAG